MGTEAYIGLLIQVPLVGIFVWFSLKIVSIFMASLDLRDRQWTTSLESRDKQWQDFLEQQRKANNEAIAHMAQRFSDEIKQLGKEVAELRGAIKT
jgi:hypothetical protein